MTWFETLTGFPEESPQQVRENITVDAQTLTSHVNKKVMRYGQLETPTLAELRERVHASGKRSGKISVREVVANVQRLHTGRFFRSLRSSICLKWCLRITHLKMVSAFMRMIARKDQHVLSLLVRERFIVTTLPSSMAKPANQQITKSIVWRISELHWEIMRAVCGK